jgi:hypothetical protein
MRGRDCILNFSVDRNEVSWQNAFLSSTMINKMLDKFVYLVFVGEFKQNVTHHFGECLKKMVSHTELKNGEK